MTFSLTGAARKALEARIAQSGVRDPVIGFVRVATEFQSDLELKRLLSLPDSDESVIRSKFLSLNPETNELNWRWAPAVYPREQLPDDFLYETDGIVFLLPGQIRQRLMNASLDVEEGGFVFRLAGESAAPF
jgi:hypothetical protein